MSGLSHTGVDRQLARIADVLEERLPPLSEANENETLKNEAELLRARNQFLFQEAREANKRTGDECSTAIAVILERDKLQFSLNKLALKHSKLLNRLNNWIISSRCTCSEGSTCARCVVSAFAASDGRDE